MRLLRFGDDPDQFTEYGCERTDEQVFALESRRSQAVSSRNGQNRERQFHRSATISSRLNLEPGVCRIALVVDARELTVLLGSAWM